MLGLKGLTSTADFCEKKNEILSVCLSCQTFERLRLNISQSENLSSYTTKLDGFILEPQNQIPKVQKWLHLPGGQTDGITGLNERNYPFIIGRLTSSPVATPKLSRLHSRHIEVLYFRSIEGIKCSQRSKKFHFHRQCKPMVLLLPLLRLSWVSFPSIPPSVMYFPCFPLTPTVHKNKPPTWYDVRSASLVLESW